LGLAVNAQYRLKDSIVNYLNYAVNQYELNVANFTDTTKFLRGYVPLSSSYRIVIASDWTSGFYPGIFWHLYDYTGNEYWRKKAITYTNAIHGQQNTKGDHDIGFIILGSYGNAYKYTHKDSFATVINTAAQKFSLIYSPLVQCTRSWFHNPSRTPLEFKPAQYPVIIDNMMNLELFLLSNNIKANNSYYNIAKSHANTTIINHIRPDSSTYHVVDYNPTTGEVRWSGTQQGYDHTSTWSRGQAWAIYGYTMMYKYTLDSLYLKNAQKLSQHFINNIPADTIVHYDFKLPDSLIIKPKDVSANSIVASAFIELFKITFDSLYLRKAEDMIHAMSKPDYRAALNTNGRFLLKHFTGGLNYQVDEASNFADYYYLEALVRYYHLIEPDDKAKHRPEIKNRLIYNANTNILFSDSLIFFDFDNDSVYAEFIPDVNNDLHCWFSNESAFNCNFTLNGIYTVPVKIYDQSDTAIEYIKFVVNNLVETKDISSNMNIFTPYYSMNYIYSKGNNDSPVDLINSKGQCVKSNIQFPYFTGNLMSGVYYIYCDKKTWKVIIP